MSMLEADKNALAALGDVTVGSDRQGNRNSTAFSMNEMNFVPKEGPAQGAYQERVRTVTLPGFHGSMIVPEYDSTGAAHRFRENLTGSIEFTYCPDGKNHCLWEDYAPEVDPTLSDKEWNGHPWCFYAQYHRLLHRLQGQRTSVFRTSRDELAGLYEGKVITTQSRVWVSSVSADSDGETNLTLGFEV
nr:MAG TPA: hypothetical protein [Caudoviricetes sp.]